MNKHFEPILANTRFSLLNQATFATFSAFALAKEFQMCVNANLKFLK